MEYLIIIKNNTALATPTIQNKKSRKYTISCDCITSRKVPANASVTSQKSWNFTGILAHSNTEEGKLWYC
ncbi:MAG: hypothetical protein JXB88_05210 [Spirochaetales bacterium]|nr:hypothetical protein [Spirochaetales bacterium]